jgi:hypothetical protein
MTEDFFQNLIDTIENIATDQDILFKNYDIVAQAVSALDKNVLSLEARIAALAPVVIPDGEELARKVELDAIRESLGEVKNMIQNHVLRDHKPNTLTEADMLIAELRLNRENPLR